MLGEGLLERGHHIGRRLQPNDIVGDRERQLHRLDQQLALPVAVHSVTRVSKAKVA